MKKKIKIIADSISPLIFLDFIFKTRTNPTRAISYYSISALIIWITFICQHPPSPREGFFYAILFVACATSIIGGGSYAASSIVKEKEKKTLTLLRMSGITGFELIFGKIAASIIYITCLVIPYFIFAAIIVLINNFSFSMFTGAVFIWCGLTYFYISSGVFISILFKKNYTASSCFYIFMLAVHFIIYFLDEVFISHESYGSYSNRAQFFSSFSPFEILNNFYYSHTKNSSSQYFYNTPTDSIIPGIGDYIPIISIYIIFSFMISLFASNILEKYLRWREE